MNTQFWQLLHKYKSVASLEKLNLIKSKYLNNQSKIKFIHITGTNGKGSVARYLNYVMTTKLNLKVGLFTSPHITYVNERIVVNNNLIKDEELLRIKNLISKDVEQYQLGFFSILVLIALIYFQEQEVQWAIIEVGIGGLLDATNIIKSDYVVITSIAKDHVELLGKNLIAITTQKLGVIKKTTKTVFVSGNINVQVLNFIKSNMKNKLIISKKINIPDYLLQNQSLTTTILKTLFSNLNITTMADAYNQTSNLLRFQEININNKKIYLDAAHNLAAIKSLIQLIKLKKIMVNKIIFSSLNSKQPTLLINELKKISKNILIYRNNNVNSIIGKDFCITSLFNNESHEVILITGSCYFTSEVYNQINNL